jgi:hypothetical protein
VDLAAAVHRRGQLGMDDRQGFGDPQELGRVAADIRMSLLGALAEGLRRRPRVCRERDPENVEGLG